MGITIHYSAKLDEKKLDEIVDYWKKQVPKMKKQFPSKEFFPYGGFKIVKRFEKVRDFDTSYDGTVINPKKGFTREDLFNAVYPNPKEGIKKTDYIKGIEIYPNVGSEAVEFIAAKQNGKWILEAHTKTQYGGIPAHMIAGRILEETKKKFLPRMSIDDEAEYFGDKGTHDAKKLKENFEESAIFIDKVFGALKKAGFEQDQIVTGGEIALKERKKLEEVV